MATDTDHYFTMKEAAKLLGVPTRSLKRHIKSDEILAYRHRGKRGLEHFIPKRALKFEIMSLIPDSSQLSLFDFQTLVLGRFEALAARGDLRVGKALKELRKEFVELITELRAFDSGQDGDVAAHTLIQGAELTRNVPERALRTPLQIARPGIGVPRTELPSVGIPLVEVKGGRSETTAGGPSSGMTRQ